MDPATLALINAGSNVLGAALTPAPTSSNAGGIRSFDNSGFNVAFDGATATSSAGVPSWVIGAGLAGALLIGLVALKKRKVAA